MTVWKCNHCGYTLEVPAPPEICPSCKAKCEFVDVSCYIPDCGGPGSPGINHQVHQESRKSEKK